MVHFTSALHVCYVPGDPGWEWGVYLSVQFSESLVCCLRTHPGTCSVMVGLPWAFLQTSLSCASSLWCILAAWASSLWSSGQKVVVFITSSAVCFLWLPLLLGPSGRNTENKKARTICSHFLGFVTHLTREEVLLLGSFGFLCNPRAMSVAASAIWSDVWDRRIKKGKKRGRFTPSLGDLGHLSYCFTWK